MKQYYAGVNYLVWLFYLSKYYELLDTFILLLKGKPSSFLQTFHHSGSILSLWTMCITRIPGMWIFTFLNSFIHTLMYYYFTLTCLGYRPTWKRHLTTMQITQFIVGNIFGIAYIVIPNCYNWNRNFRENVLQHEIFGGSYYASIVFTFAFNLFFVGSLIILFRDFARRTYGKKSASKSESVTESAVDEKPKKKTAVKAKESVKKPRTKTSPVQIATSVVIEAEPEVAAAAAANPAKARAASKARSTSKARAVSKARTTSKARASSPAKKTSSASVKPASSPAKARSPSKARAASPVRRSRRS